MKRILSNLVVWRAVNLFIYALTYVKEFSLIFFFVVSN